METSQASQAQQPAGPADSGQESSGQTAVKQQQEALRRYKVKVDGQEREVDEKELLRGYEHAQAAHKRMQEAAEQRKKFERLRQDPNAIFDIAKEYNLDPDAWAHNYVLSKLQYEMMSPEERERYDLKRENARYKQTEAQRKKQEYQEKLNQARQNAATELESQLIEFYEKIGEGIPNTHMVGRMLEYILAAHDNRMPISFEQAHAKAKRDFEQIENGTFESKLKAMIATGQIPKDLVEAVRKADLADLRGQPVSKRAQRESQRGSAKPMTVDEWFNSRSK